MMEAFGLPCPAFMALGGLFSLLAGSFCYLTGRQPLILRACLLEETPICGRQASPS